MNAVNRRTPVLLTIGLVLWLESLVTVEWTYTYCLSQTDGPAYAAYGMPLPYWMRNGVVSLEHDFMPLAYILNVIVLCLLMFPAVRRILKYGIFSRSKWLRKALGIVGGLMLLSHIALTGLLVSSGFYRPQKSLGLEGYYRYADFRPVRFGFIKSNAAGCTPSRFWFPDGWHPE